MNSLRALALCAVAIVVVEGAIAATPPDAAKAAEHCENAVAETIKRMRGRDARDVQFTSAKRALAVTSEEETGVTGEGRYAAPGGAVSFTYSCAFNPKTGSTSGVLFRETGGPQKVYQPDITNVSPQACESATAAALKEKYPFVGRIQFDSDTRQLQARSDTLVSLEGDGAVQRATGMNAVAFKYRCEIDTRSGKVVAVQTSD